MAFDDVPYLRPAYGPRSWWYRHVLAGRPVAFAMGDGRFAERDRTAALALPREPVRASYVPAAEPAQAGVDEELRRRYRTQRASLASMLTDEAPPCTLRIDRAGPAGGDTAPSEAHTGGVPLGHLR